MEKRRWSFKYSHPSLVCPSPLPPRDPVYMPLNGSSVIVCAGGAAVAVGDARQMAWEDSQGRSLAQRQGSSLSINARHELVVTRASMDDVGAYTCVVTAVDTKKKTTTTRYTVNLHGTQLVKFTCTLQRPFDVN